MRRVVFLRLDPAERIASAARPRGAAREGRSFDPDAWEEFLTWASGYDDPEFTGRSLWAHEEWLAEVGPDRC